MSQGLLCRNPRHRIKKRERGVRCMDCANAAKVRARYGITMAERAALYEDSDGLCAVCYEYPAQDVDHDHATGQVRGAVCRRCNVLLTAFDNPDLHAAILDYLDRDWADVIN